MDIISHPESDSLFTGTFDEHAAFQGCHIVSPDELLVGQQIATGYGFSTVIPSMDFETYSEAGYLWRDDTRKWVAPPGATKKGIAAVGGAVYAQHPSTEVISLAYDLKDGNGPRLWVPGCPPPADLFNHLAAGGLIEAWNCDFEWYIWRYVCVERMGWPAFKLFQLRDAMAKARAWALPGSLDLSANVVDAHTRKDKAGERLIKIFSIPQNPTKKRPSTRITVEDEPQDAARFYSYNIYDIRAEESVSLLAPDLPPEELAFWQLTLESNTRGIGLDMPSIQAAVSILDQAQAKYNQELANLTFGTINSASETAKIRGWLGAYGVKLSSLDADAVNAALKCQDLPANARRVLEIRQLIGSAGVKKLYAMLRMAGRDGRAHSLLGYHVARTGRDGGQDIQPQNLVKNGPDWFSCGCGAAYGAHLARCPSCGETPSGKPSPWSWEAVDRALEIVRTGDLGAVEFLWGDAVLLLSGCIRGLFVAGPGCDLLCSDYSSIEAVVTAVLAGEQWRIEAFQNREDIYLVSAGQITGRTMAEYLEYAEQNGQKHPDRQKIGKPAELGLGFGGWVNAWYQFDSSGTYTEEQVKDLIKAWRAASPAVEELWGGQVRGLPWRPDRRELYGLEGAAIAAIQNPGQCFNYTPAYNPFGHSGITYGVKDNVLYCRLPSGRCLSYHRPRLVPSERWEDQVSIEFEGYNTNPKNGPTGWITMYTYGGKLTENVVQATARDILRDGVIALDRTGYKSVLRVHDEVITEVPAGFGSIDELERIMSTMPAWAAGWPVRAAGGWRGHRYRKD